jgi:hypothetical protein
MNATSSFLIRSQKRVLDHCRDLLAAGNLDAEERRRLERLAQEAQAALAAHSDTEGGNLWAA